MTPLDVGEDVDSFCRKCELTLAHIVLARDEKRVLRVECKTCRNQHAHRAAPGATKTKVKAKAKATGTKTAGTKTTRARATSGARQAANLYQQVLEGRDPARAASYRISAEFDVGEMIAHPNFGTGVITKQLADQKIEVAFESGTKVLIHQRS